MSSGEKWGDLAPAFSLLVVIMFAVFAAAIYTKPPPPQPTTTAGETGEKPAEAQDQTEQKVPDVQIEVNIPATEMTVYEDSVPIFRRRVAIGRGIYPTPTQESHIKRIEWNPWWLPPTDSSWAKNAKPTPPGPGNPLGVVKMPLSDAIMFHGTNKDWSVGSAASHGCMRMHNNEVADIAWYLQNLFSTKTDPSLKELYRKNSRTTYVVKLDKPVPVRLVYKPIIFRDDALIFFPDHYNRLAGRRKSAIIKEILGGEIDLGQIDDTKIDDLSKNWPTRGVALPIENITRDAPMPGLLDILECS